MAQIIENQGEKLRNYLRQAGYVQEDVAKLLGMSRNSLLYHLRKDRLEYEFMLKLKDKGFGAFVSSLANANMAEHNVIQVGANATQSNVSIKMVTLVPQHAYAGYLSGFGDTEYMEELPKVPMIVDGEYKGTYMAFEVRGDSMADGTDRSYLEGDQVFCREIGKQHWGNKLHISRWDFIIVHKDGIVLKQIVDHNTATGDLTLHSINPFYSDYIINLRDVYQLFNVVQVSRKK